MAGVKSRLVTSELSARRRRGGVRPETEGTIACCDIVLHGSLVIGKNGCMEPSAGERIVTVFRSRLADDAEANGYGELAAQMETRARQMPGFVDFKTFEASDGERVSLVVFDTLAHHEIWRDDPEHRSAQQRGRDTFYREYAISVCHELQWRHFDNADALHAEAES